jgi:carbon monoxide dehydrogenase subunit G
MTRITVSVHVRAPRKAVWDEVARIERHGDWMADVVAVEFLGSQHRGAGTRVSVATRIGPFHTADLMEFTEWSDPEAMGVAHQGLFTGQGRFTLTPEGDGTRFTWAEDLRFPWYLGGSVGAWLARPVLARIWRNNLRRLAARFRTP